MDKQKVFLVEHRMQGPFNEVGMYESVIAFVGSTYEKAVDFIQTNEDWIENNSNTIEWWAIYTEVINSKDPFEKVNIHFFDSKGVELYDQPCWGDSVEDLREKAKPREERNEKNQ